MASNWIYSQFHHPRGPLGALAGWIMAHRPSNRLRNRWTVDLLQVAATDRVLELGMGPGLAVAMVAEQLVSGHIVGLDHSRAMCSQARRRNASALANGRVSLLHGGAEAICDLGSFDKVFSVNVLQFEPDLPPLLMRLRAALTAGGVLASTYQPRHRGARPDDAQRFADRLSGQLAQCGFEGVRIDLLPLRPMPAVCVLAQRA